MIWFVIFDISYRNLVEDTQCFYVRTPDLSGLSVAQKDWVFFHTLGIEFGWVLSSWDTETRLLSLDDGREIFMLDYWEENPSQKPTTRLLNSTLWR